MKQTVDMGGSRNEDGKASKGRALRGQALERKSMRDTEPIPTRIPGRGAGLRPLVNRRASDRGVARFKDCDSRLWLEAINGCLEFGLGLLISRTSDGGAVSVTVYEGNDRSRSYAATAEELAEVLAAVRDRATSYGK